MTAARRLMKEYKKFISNEFYSVRYDEDDILHWYFEIYGPIDTYYEGGIFKGEIKFPKSYPINAPKVKFFNMIHPNVYTNGDVCISILHEGSDSYGYENDIERWSPTHNVDSILMSIISMLNDPNFESPANMTASVKWKNNPNEYKKDIYRLVAESQK